MIPNSIFRYLGLRARTEKEVRDYIRKKELPDEDQIIDRLKELKYIDDAEFVRLYVRSRKGRSSRLMELELQRKGITTKLHEDDHSIARAALERKSQFKSREQAIRFLQSRGFSWAVIADIIAEIYDRR